MPDDHVPYDDDYVTIDPAFSDESPVHHFSILIDSEFISFLSIPHLRSIKKQVDKLLEENDL